jgi:nitrogen fixation/metabolism regulation signal transduction histidine kinase
MEAPPSANQREDDGEAGVGGPPPLPGSLLDRVLISAPLHVFVFDRRLICRYAAPAGDRFLGRTRDQLVGCHAAEVVPSSGNGLQPALERVAAGGAIWQHPSYRYRHRTAAREMRYIWTVQARPLPIEDETGVLLMLQDVIDAVHERDRLENENNELRAALVAEHGRQAAARRARHELRAKIRNLLAPVAGYLQVIARRPSLLADQSVAEIIEKTLLPQLRSIATTVDEFDESAAGSD